MKKTSMEYYSQLLDDYIRINIDNIDWNDLMVYTKLSHTVLKELKDNPNINWHYVIYTRRNISKEFLIDFMDKIDFNTILINQKLEPVAKEYLALLTK